MKVEYVDHMGSDLSVANAARVSFAKQVDLMTERDEKLLSYLATHGHWSPFAHAFLSLRIEAPIYVARQLVKHQVGLSWNEVSRRYVDYTPTFDPVTELRGKAENKKQGSGEALDKPWLKTVINANLSQQVTLYDRLLEEGVCPEQARMVLPLAVNTEWVWSGSLMAWIRVLQQRLKPDAQKETRDVAERIAAHVRVYFYKSYRAWFPDEV